MPATPTVTPHARRFTTARLLAAALAAATLPALAPAPAAAQTRTFDGDGDGTSYGDPLNWSADNVPDTAGEDAVIDGGGTFDVNGDLSASIGDFTLGSDDTYSLNSARSLFINGGDVFNNGLFTINTTSGTGDATLDPSAPLTISGVGTIQLNAAVGGSAADAGIGGASNDFAVTNSAGHTIAGVGQIITAFTNNGTVDADVNGGTLLLNGGPKARAIHVFPCHLPKIGAHPNGMEADDDWNRLAATRGAGGGAWAEPGGGGQAV